MLLVLGPRSALSQSRENRHPIDPVLDLTKPQGIYTLSVTVLMLWWTSKEVERERREREAKASGSKIVKRLEKSASPARTALETSDKMLEDIIKTTSALDKSQAKLSSPEAAKLSPIEIDDLKQDINRLAARKAILHQNLIRWASINPEIALALQKGAQSTLDDPIAKMIRSVTEGQKIAIEDLVNPEKVAAAGKQKMELSTLKATLKAGGYFLIAVGPVLTLMEVDNEVENARVVARFEVPTQIPGTKPGVPLVEESPEPKAPH